MVPRYSLSYSMHLGTRSPHQAWVGLYLDYFSGFINLAERTYSEWSEHCSPHGRFRMEPPTLYRRIVSEMGSDGGTHECPKSESPPVRETP